jgi:hypothetical protein
LETPASFATSSSFAAAKPRALNTVSAASRISAGRASARRRQRGPRRAAALPPDTFLEAGFRKASSYRPGPE